ncbi:MAG: sulfatase [Pirellulaceae bacterium]|nr:sulfatase [Pirellulaceae bacterium]
MSDRLFAVALTTVVLVGLPMRDAVAARPPNVIVILADDLGYSDLGCQGGKLYKTPHIDSLAEHGVRCTSGYTSGCVCAPTRSGLMTGRYQQRFGFEFNPAPMTQAAGEAAYFGLPVSETTLADMLRGAGYKTGMVGKWHLGQEPQLVPTRRGFDDFFGFLEGAHNFIYNAQYDDDPREVIVMQRAIFRGTQVVREKEYLTDAFAREAVEFVDRNQKQPFFLYLPFNAVHSPLQAPPKYLERVAGIGDRQRELYAAVLTAMDDAIGRVLDKLRELKIEEETLIFFLSDNGGAPWPYNATNNLPLNGKKGQLVEGGMRVPFLVQWRGKLPEGKTYDEPVSSLDIFSTSVAAVGATLPTDRIIDGVNLLPYLQGKNTTPPHDALYWRYGDDRAMRRGQWKLIKTKDYPAQLYNLSKDIGETTDLSQKETWLVNELETQLKRWDAELIPPSWRPENAYAASAADFLYEMLSDDRLLALPALPTPRSPLPTTNSKP